MLKWQFNNTLQACAQVLIDEHHQTHASVPCFGILDENILQEHSSIERAVVKRLVHLSPDQEVLGSNPNGGLNFKISESALSTTP